MTFLQKIQAIAAALTDMATAATDLATQLPLAGTALTGFQTVVDTLVP